MSKKVTRLFEQYNPKHYELYLDISEDKQTFSGTVAISGKKVGRPSQRITLHQKALKITKATVFQKQKDGSFDELEISRINTQDSYDEVRLHSEKLLYPGEYTITLEFTGNITDNMDGIYPSRFEEDGVEKKLIATQFESHHAREAFPCIDEPEAKATFDLHLTHAESEIALGNTPMVNEKVEGGRKTTSYDTTPFMSTYLLAFVIGDIAYQEATSKNGVKIRTYATKNQVEHTTFALDIAVKCMDYYEDYYDIAFPLGKCDFVALPDFASGAMENWGLITFREQTLLMDPDNTSLMTKQYVAIVVAHELTHQWFGNLVTMRWWTDLWLNEGFASWMEYLAIDHLFPEWDLWTQFAVDEQQLAMKIDSLEHTHPVEVEVNHPDEIRSIFDAISYQKGASMIHMLQDYLGAEPFRDGLRHYLKKHSYKNTHTVDLWQALEDVTKKPVKDFMGTWTSQSGFPIVDIKQVADHYVIEQSKFVANPNSEARKDTTLWPIPLLHAELHDLTVTKKTTNIPVAETNIVKINIGQTGFYRVNYSHDMQQKQLQSLDNGEFSAVDRMGLLADSFEVTKSGYQSVDEYLDLLTHYKNEHELPSWEIISGSLGTIRATLSSDDTSTTLRDAMKPWIQTFVAPQLQRLGIKELDDEPHLDTLLRPIIVGMSASADEPTVLEFVDESFKSRLKDGESSIDPNLRGTIYATIARRGGVKEFDQMLDMYNITQSSDEKLSLTAGMTNFKQPEIHKRIFELIKSDTIRTQDNSYWIAYSFMNRYSRADTWQWVKDNWEWLKKTMGTDMSFSRMPIYAARQFADQAKIDDYIEFFSDKIDPSIKRTYNQGLEIAQTACAWRTRDHEAALKWFTDTKN
jgi:puromycin-sensitive aminopeptidase